MNGKASEVDTQLDKGTLLELYERMLRIRKFESAVQDNYKKGEIPGFIHLCIGQEAVAVGTCYNLRKEDTITSTHRGHGHALAKGIGLSPVMAELYGKATGTNGGRGGSMHIYSPEYGLLGTNGFVGGGIPLAVGLGLSYKVKKNDGVAVSFFGDGAINHGTFHESVCFAAVQKAPVVFLCENNLYATCTPFSETSLNNSIAERTSSYGIPTVSVDGNDVLAMMEETKRAIDRARKGEGPSIVEALTYRTVGHHEGDVVVGTYRTQEELDSWKEKDPIKRFEKYLLDGGHSTQAEINETIANVDLEIKEAVEFARASENPSASTVTDHCWHNPINPEVALKVQKLGDESKRINWISAVRDGIAEEMRRDEHIIYLGEGIGERGGTFGHTKNLWQEFGGERLIDTPICELAFTGAAAAASAAGCRAIADLMFADFIFESTSQIINQSSKLRYMSNGQISVPMVIRAGSGQIKQAGPHHSGTFHSIWSHCPGLIVVMPSNPVDAKGLMKTALRASDPVIFLEPKALFSSKAQIPVEEYYVPFGKAKIINKGSDITIVTFGLPVYSCLEASAILNEDGISCEVIDLRTIVPFDREAIIESVKKTGHLLVVEEGYQMCSMASEIASLVTEECFKDLKQPVGRLNKAAVPQPFSPVLEEEITLSKDKVVLAVNLVLEGKPLNKQGSILTGI